MTGLLKITNPSPPLEEEVDSLLQKDAIVQVHNPDIALSFFSRCFTIPKKEGCLCPILDLHPLNSYITH